MEAGDTMAIVILAAGLGTRMKSDKAKVLHCLSEKPMISYVVETASKIVGIENVVVVVGHQAEAVRREVVKQGPALFAYQAQQNGTGHAVWCALDHLPQAADEVLILCGDVPLLTAQTLKNLIKIHRKESRDVTLLTVRLETPTGYGRIIQDSRGNVLKIVEEADASEAEKAIDTVNAGIYCVKKAFLKSSLSSINSDNAQNELYLTDIIEVACCQGKRVGVLMTVDPDEVVGVNSVNDLDRAEALLRDRQL